MWSQVRGVVVVPSQGLARQVVTVFSQVAAHTRVHCGLVCGEWEPEVGQPWQ